MTNPRQRIQDILDKQREEKIIEIAETLADMENFRRGPFRFYPEARAITYTGPDNRERPLRLTPRSYYAAMYLAKRPGIIMTRPHLADLIGIDDEVSDRAVDSAIKRFRREVGVKSRKTVNPIITVYGEGYRWRSHFDGD